MTLKASIQEEVAALESSLSAAYFPITVLDVAGGAPFRTKLETHDLNWFRATRSHLSARAYRSALARVDPVHPRQYVLQVTLDGGQRFLGDGIDASTTAGSLVLLGQTRHFRVEQDGACEALAIALPAGLLRAQIRNVDAGCFDVVSAEVGAAAILKRLVTEVWDQHESLSEHDAREIANVVTGLLRAVWKLSDSGDSGNTLDLKIKELERVVEQHLERADLGPDLVAREMGISKSYVFALAARYGTTVRNLIIDKRLERCRSALLEPAQAHNSLTEIAFGWGFQDMSHFSRRFQAKFGLRPSELRKYAVSPVVSSIQGGPFGQAH